MLDEDIKLMKIYVSEELRSEIADRQTWREAEDNIAQQPKQARIMETPDEKRH